MKEKNLKKILKQKNGITLIALVVTIIVLLILAGVSIAMLTGNNGILSQAQNAQEQTEIAKIKEEIQVKISAKQTENLKSSIYDKDLQVILEEYGTLEGEGNILDKTLLTNNGDRILVRDIWNGTVEKEPVILKIGDYVKYDVTYTDVYTNYEFTSENGWRVLETGQNNGDGTYTGVKLISTGIPASLDYSTYGDNTIENKVYNGEYGNWAGNESQRNAYADLFWSSYNNNNNNQNMYAAAGLYFNFTKIKFSRGLDSYGHPNDNEGYYININGQTEGELGETAFLKEGATRVYNLTLAELNIARGEEDLRSTSKPNADDGAKGLFWLAGLEEYGYNTENSWDYILASPDTSSNTIYTVIDWYGIDYGMGPYGIRPVVELPDNFPIEKTK